MSEYGIPESLERENAYFMAHMNDNDTMTCSKPGHVHGCPGTAGGDHEYIDASPGEGWEEDEEGYVKAPLSYENREGDPAFNGAFDKW